MRRAKTKSGARDAGAIGRIQSAMVNWRLVALPALLAPLLLVGADYSIDWWTIDGGGGTSTNGPYSLSGTIGQPDAGAMSGGNFTLQGGFWGVVAAVQTPGAPFLSVTNLGSYVRVSWPAPADGWLLERTNILTGVAGRWTPLSPPYQTNSGVISVTYTNAPPVGNQFFRLHKP